MADRTPEPATAGRRPVRSLLVALAVVASAVAAGPAGAARVGAVAPSLDGGPWINSEPLTIEALRGRVVLVEFWTYG